MIYEITQTGEEDEVEQRCRMRELNSFLNKPGVRLYEGSRVRYTPGHGTYHGIYTYGCLLKEVGPNRAVVKICEVELPTRALAGDPAPYDLNTLVALTPEQAMSSLQPLTPREDPPDTDLRIKPVIKIPPDTGGVNPKDLIGITKPNLFLVPPSAEIYLALAFQDGAAKYGPYNWREKKVKASVYIAACKRHIGKYIDGLNIDAGSGKPELAHAMACLAILADATETGNLHDDRPKPGSAPELLEFWTEK